MHERGVRAAGGVQHHQAGQRDQGAVPGRLRGPDQPDLHIHEHSPECVSVKNGQNFSSFKQFPSYRATLVQRPEFCLVIARLRKSCSGFKREGIELNYPGLCQRCELFLEQAWLNLPT